MSIKIFIYATVYHRKDTRNQVNKMTKSSSIISSPNAGIIGCEMNGHHSWYGGHTYNMGSHSSMLMPPLNVQCQSHGPMVLIWHHPLRKPTSLFFKKNFYCYSITVVCLFSPSLHPTPAEPPLPPSLPPSPLIGSMCPL